MTTAEKTASSQSTGYGYGVMVGNVRGEQVIEHNGGIDGFSTQVACFPKQAVTVIALANRAATCLCGATAVPPNN
jgi:D-alanyl-D-alanine carboxypeptidase